MTGTQDWPNAVRITHGVELARAMTGPSGSGRATACEFSGDGGSKTWIGLVSMPPGGDTGGHSHGRHEVALHVIRGAGRILWGEGLEFGADIVPGNFITFTPGVPHAEVNADKATTLDFLVVRSDAERIFLPHKLA